MILTIIILYEPHFYVKWKLTINIFRDIFLNFVGKPEYLGVTLKSGQAILIVFCLISIIHKYVYHLTNLFVSVRQSLE